MKTLLELRTNLGIEEPYVKDGLEYYLQQGMVYCKCVDESIIRVNILEGTDVISNSGFWGLSRLREITLPSTLKRLSTFTCMYCPKLERIRILCSKVEVVGYGYLFNHYDSPLVIECYKGCYFDNAYLYPTKVEFKYI